MTLQLARVPSGVGVIAVPMVLFSSERLQDGGAEIDRTVERVAFSLVLVDLLTLLEAIVLARLLVAEAELVRTDRDAPPRAY